MIQLSIIKLTFNDQLDSDSLPVDGFKWIKETLQYNVDLKKGYKDDKIIG